MKTARFPTRYRWLGAGCALLLACGGEEASEISGAPMAQAPPAAADHSSSLNAPPRIDRVDLSPSSPRPGERVVASVGATDPDGDEISFRYEWRVDGRRTGQSGPSFHVEDATRGSQIELLVVARDAAGQSPASRASVRVGNRRPLMEGVVIEPLKQVSVGSDISASPRATDPDGDPIDYRFTWRVNGRRVDVDGPVLAASHFERGDEIVVTVTASDGTDESDPLRSSPIPVVNAGPRITSTPPPHFEDDGSYRYRVTAEDPDGDRTFRYRLLEAPKGMDIDVVDGQLVWRPTDDQAGDHKVEIEVADRKGGVATQSFVVTLGFEEPDGPPAARAN